MKTVIMNFQDLGDFPEEESEVGIYVVRLSEESFEYLKAHRNSQIVHGEKIHQEILANIVENPEFPMPIDGMFQISAVF